MESLLFSVGRERERERKVLDGYFVLGGQTVFSSVVIYVGFSLFTFLILQNPDNQSDIMREG